MLRSNKSPLNHMIDSILVNILLCQFSNCSLIKVVLILTEDMPGLKNQDNANLPWNMYGSWGTLLITY